MLTFGPLLSNGNSSLLIVLEMIPLCTSILLLAVPSLTLSNIRSIALNASLLTFVLSLPLYVLFDPTQTDFQFCYQLNSEYVQARLLNLSFGFGIDGLNVWLILLTTFLTPICILVGWNMAHTPSIGSNKITYLKTYCIIFLVIEVLLILAFTSRDIFVFYVFFEAVLVPMFFLLGMYGSQPRNIRAAFKMFFYTLAGSLPMLAGIIMMVYNCGTTDYEVLSNSSLSHSRQIIIFVLWFIGLSVKTPLIPMHGWLPETHANAPTSGSIILAGLLLKLGTYGMLRWLIGILPEACMYFTPMVNVICLVGVIYVSLITLRQVDIKKVIAYSSIAHMAVCVIGMFTFNVVGVSGSYLLMIGHGVISPALFLCCGILYDRYKTRIIFYYSGLAQTMPLFSTALLILTMANMSLPILSPTFAAEFLIFAGVFATNKLTAIAAATTMVLTGAYSLFLYNRICFGNVKSIYISKYSDLNRREFALLLPLVACCVILGVFPSIILDCCHNSIVLMLLR